MTNVDESIESRIKGYIEAVKGAPLDIELADIGAKHLINDLGMDSLDVINVLFQIEENEGIAISETEMESENLFDFQSLAAHLRKMKG